jgi:hypothetical protein
MIYISLPQSSAFVTILPLNFILMLSQKASLPNVYVMLTYEQKLTLWTAKSTLQRLQEAEIMTWTI